MTDPAVLADLRAEGEDLEALVAPLSDADRAAPTPSPGWTIGHQLAHLAWTDEIAVLAATDPGRFRSAVEEAMDHVATYVDDAAAAGSGRPDLLAHWRSGREDVLAALAAVPEGTRLPWFGPPMSATSMATARLMETWAHGQDIADALGVERAPTARLRNIAHLGVRTRDFAYLLNDRPPPREPFRVELVAPDGSSWTWGPEDADARVTGTSLDFCLLVTQRRHRDDLEIAAVGADAQEWLSIAQAFAGAPGGGRGPGQFR